MTSTVILIMKLDSVMLFESLVECTSVWVADSLENAQLKCSLRLGAQAQSITWFPLRDGESLEDAATRIAFSLDDHFNEDAQPVGYRSLLVFGAEYRPTLIEKLMPLGFSRSEATSFGFILVK